MTQETTTGRVNIALTGPAEIAKDSLKTHLPFTEGLHMMRLGLAYAVRLNLSLERGAHFGRPGDGQNVNVGSFDPTGEIRALVQAIHPEQSDPYQVAETLMSKGIVQIVDDLNSGTVTTIADVMYSDGHPGT